MSENSEKKVTLVIPVYNAGHNIERCVDSILRQTSDEFEVLFIDDGSTDDSLMRIREIESSNPELFRVIAQENTGVAETRIRGIGQARTPYVTLMDQDDFIDPDYIETLLCAIEETGADIVMSGHRHVTDTELLYEVSYGNDELSRFLATTVWSKIFRRDFIIENDIRFLKTNIGEDTYFVDKAYLLANKVEAIDYVGYNWYMNEASVSNIVHRGLRDDYDLLILMNALDELYGKHDAKTEIFEYFMVHRMTLDFLWSGRDASRDRFMEEYERYFSWLDEHGYRLRIPFFDKRLSAETLSRRMIVSIFSKLRKLHLVGLFGRVYCRG